MSKLKIDSVDNDKPITITIKLPASIHQDLIAYADVLKRHGSREIEPNSLIAPMLKRFMATDRAFRRARRQIQVDEG